MLANSLRRIAASITATRLGPCRGLKTKLYREQLPKYRINVADLAPISPQVSLSEKLSLYKQQWPKNSSTALLEALLDEQNNVEALLQIIGQNSAAMNSFHTAISFEAIDDLIRRSPEARNTILASPEFKKLCYQTLYKIRYYDADEILKLAKCLASLQVPEETLIVQATFQMARQLVNDFSMDELKILLGLNYRGLLSACPVQKDRKRISDN